MQPLVYLGARVALAYLQILERSSRAFVCSVPTVLAAGAAHCWAVVYALIVAVLMQMIRLTGGRGDYADLLPAWVVFTEQCSSVMMLVWCLAGTAICYIRVVQVDEHAQGLPVDRRGAGWPAWMRFAYSPGVKAALQAAHMLSGAGLFLSVLLLCAAMFGTGGSATTCDTCLVATACVFALPHAAVAARLVAAAGGALRGGAALSMASEAAVLGPQLCVLWATADIYGKASPPQRGLYALTTAAYAASVCACGAAPPRGDGDATPSTFGALAVSIVASCASVITLVVSFPNLRDWLLWAVAAVELLLCAALSCWDVREPFLEILEPIMPLQSKRPRRSPLSAALQLLVLASSASAAWGVYAEHLRPPPPYSQGAAYGSDYVSMQPRQHEHPIPMAQQPRFSHADRQRRPAQAGPPPRATSTTRPAPPQDDARLVLRWREDAEAARASAGVDVDALLALAAGAMGLRPSHLAAERVLHEHRLLIFRAVGGGPPTTPWQAALVGAAEGGGVARAVEAAFPAELSASGCDGGGDALRERGARDAHAAACAAWAELRSR